MIIDNSYFVNEIFIPHAKPSISDDVTAVSADITSFIDTYSKECLIKCLGYALFKEFSEQLDFSKPNGLKDGANAKWDKLLNGHEEWKGIRYKTTSEYNKSFLADYVYYFYEKSEDDDRVGIGNVKQSGKNSTLVSKTPKVVAAWRRFFNAVQGGQYFPSIYTMTMPVLGVNGFGIDWLAQSEEMTLYKYIKDTNTATPDTYVAFKPFSFTNANQFGI